MQGLEQLARFFLMRAIGEETPPARYPEPILVRSRPQANQRLPMLHGAAAAGIESAASTIAQSHVVKQASSVPALSSPAGNPRISPGVRACAGSQDERSPGPALASVRGSPLYPARDVANELQG